MNPQIEKLYQSCQKKERRILGLMSGTSLDGLDIALCTVSGCGRDTKIRLEQFVILPYDDIFRNQIRQVFAKRDIDQQELCGLNALIGVKHAQLIKRALQKWHISAEEVDCIASHGQTVYHAPQSLTGDNRFPNSTLQIGDADHIAMHTGIITVSDFRQKHLAAGGEGAPLAAYGDYLLFSDEKENRFLLNIGGISNFTFIPNKTNPLKAFATDIGPGNTMMNQFVREQYNLEMDENGDMARRGTINTALLNELLNDPFFTFAIPKTTGPEHFNLTYLKNALRKSHTEHIPNEDILATLNIFSARTISDAIKGAALTQTKISVYVSGGGVHNSLLMYHLQQHMIDFKVENFRSLGIDPDAKEAILFAVLANETLAGNPSNVADIKDSPEVCMGKISIPQ